MDIAAFELNFLYRRERVCGLSGLSHRKMKGCWIDDRIVVPKLARYVSNCRDSSQLLNQQLSNFSGVVGSTAAKQTNMGNLSHRRWGEFYPTESPTATRSV